MPDPHVNSLRYALRPCEDISFDSPPPVEFETDEAKFRLADGTLTCEMKPHFSSADEARHAVEPTIRAWEVDAGLRLGRRGLRFTFENADVVDRTPQPPGSQTAYACVAVGSLTMTGSATVHVGCKRYPTPPPSSFRLNPDTESILARYEGYRNGREPLQSMAYFCLTLLEAKAGGRQKASTAFGIDMDVLRKIGELTSDRPDGDAARKAKSARQLTGSERAWLEEVVKALIWRVGDTRGTRVTAKLAMADLPKL